MEKLMWDSNFWEVDIFSIDENNLNELIAPQLNTTFLIECLVDTSNRQSIYKLENKGFHFIQNKLIFEKEILSSSSQKKDGIHKLRLSDIADIIYYVPEMFINMSRYNLFNEDLIGKFYCTWVENSIKGIFDDGCFGYFVKEELAGFITYKIFQCELKIGLVGVFPQYQGQSISQRLLEFIEHYAAINNCNLITVSTQGINYKAINAYTKNGFKLKNISSWYYKENI